VSANAFYAGMHWSKRKKLADLYHAALIEHRAKRFKTPAHLTFTFSFKGRLTDVDNCFAMIKLLIDSLRHWRIIPDDTPADVASISVRVEKGIKDTVSIIAA
jgi:Holliday junction resolvase RusA-like endonuclease